MPNVKVDLRQAGDSGGGFSVLPPGPYLIRCVLAKVQKNQSGPGNVIWTEWRVRSPQEQQGAKILEIFTLQPENATFLRNMMMAISGKDVPKTVLNINTDTFLNKDAGAIITNGEFKSKRTGKMQKSSDVSEWMTVAAFQALRTPTRNGAPSVQEAVAEADALDADDATEEYEYEDPEEAEEEEDEEKAEEFTL